MIGLLIFLGIVGLIVWAISSSGGKQKKSELSRRNQEWVDFIAGYGRVAQNAKEKALVVRMLDDIAQQGLGEPSVPLETAAKPWVMSEHAAELASQGTAVATGTAATTAVANTAVQAGEVYEKGPDLVADHAKDIQLDNASLLLYFGAFLFVAAAGLFVAFGGADGVVRTFVTVLVTAVMYGSGIWLYRTKPRLKQAGQAFAGIGVVLAPLVGVAVYNYLFDQQYGMAVWMATSLLCLALYTHALFVFRSALVSYLLILTFVSLFESGVGVADMPIYYYGWGLAAAGLCLQLLHRFKRGFPELQDASSQGAAVLLPVAVAVSLLMVPSRGASQLGVSLLLAALYYGLDALRTRDNEQQLDAVVSQVTAMLGVAALTYGATESRFALGVSLVVVSLVQLLVAIFSKLEGKLWFNFGSVLLAMAVATVFVGIGYPTLLLMSTVYVVLVGAFFWARQRREDSYGLAALALMAALYIAGQVTYGPLDITEQTLLGFGGLLVLLGAYLSQKQRAASQVAWRQVALATYAIAAASVLVCSVFGLPLLSLVAALAVALTFLVLARYDGELAWVDAAGFILFVPLLRTADEPQAFLLSTGVVLLVLVALALRYRREALRWASTLVWLLVPVALGHAAVGGAWHAEAYAWAYVVTMIVLVISRVIARGTLYFSKKAPLVSYLQNASLSYVVGYSAAAVLAVCISTAATNSRLHTTLILGVLSLMTIIVAEYVEKRDEIIALLPVLGQGLLLSAIQPDRSLHALYLFLALSSALAILLYVAFSDLRRQASDGRPGLQSALVAAVATAFVSPASVLFGAEANVWMAVGLLAAGLLLLFHIRAQQQGSKELAGGVIVLALWWLLYFAHVHELQAYVHVVVATLGLYAYLRYKRGETQQSDMYLWWMLGTATVPLALQALDSAKGLYGWWFLFEQVAIMLLGMSIGKRFVTRWGLYAGVAAVLYQLRGQGYAALAVLAVFLIALAIYKLQKYNDPK